MVRAFRCLTLICTIAAPLTTSTAMAEASPATPCRPGYVWREAFAGDYVCVTPEVRAQAQIDNSTIDRTQPDGAYGPQTCKSGYVWREASPKDTVCVTPEIRAATAEDNRLAASRLAGATAIPPAAKVREAPVVHRNPGDLPAHGTPVPMGPPENSRCRDYANQAVADFKTMQSAPKCAIPPDGRWQGKWQKHYDWCVSASAAAISNEMHQRSAHLLACGATHSL
jgi:hypothetical protein